MKTIFISITRGGLARNILRTGIVQGLLKHNIKIVIIVPVAIHEYFKNEFNHENIILESVKSVNYSKFRKLFIFTVNGLVYTETERRKLKFGGALKKGNSKFVFLVKDTFFSFVSKFVFLKKIARWFEENLFIEKDYDYLFDKYKPDLVFCSSIYATMDTVLIKAAKRKGVKSVTTPKSWDTVGRLFFRALSDKILLNNGYMKQRVIKEQLVKEDDIAIVGFPQFDVYRNKQNFLTKDEFCNITGLDKDKPVILYASEGAWTNWDEIYIEELINKYRLLDKYNLILRPHYSNLDEKIYHKFKQHNNVYIDDQNIRMTNMFADKWDPTYDNMSWLADVINCSDVVITFVSTFTLDVFAFDKPVINIYYDLEAKDRFEHWIPMKELYNCVHYNAVLDEKGVALAENGEDVMRYIEKYLQNKEYLKEEREHTVNKLCYRLDGRSSERIVENIIKNIE